MQRSKADTLVPYRQEIHSAISPQTLQSLQAGLQMEMERLKSAPSLQEKAIFSLCEADAGMAEIERIATHWRGIYAHIVVIGCGGSGLSGKALASILSLETRGEKSLHVLDNLDADGVLHLLAHLPLKECCFFIVSKSGGTLETLAFTDVVFSALHQNGLLARIAERAVVMSVEKANPLRELADEHGIFVLAHDPDLCGRFSILSAVGLLPAAFLGLDIHALLAGARTAFASPQYAVQGAALQYACMRQQNINVLMPYGESLFGIAQWWRQAWAESLGKGGKGTTPVISLGPCDQHSQLQLYLDGPRDKLFTLLMPQTQGKGAALSKECSVTYIRGKTFGDIASAMQRATAETLIKQDCPVRMLHLPAVNETIAGALIMQWQIEIMLTAHLLQVNPFDQPAVEESKRLAREYLAD